MKALSPLAVTLALDVEEEGLFCGAYAQKNISSSNLACLDRLKPFLEKNIHITLFCSSSILKNPEARKIFENLKKDSQIEIGAHLHHWNTPPFSNPESLPVLKKVPSREVPPALMKKKLDHLLDELENFFGKRPTSFRMGRWDLHEVHWPMLFNAGILCDASVRPMHAKTDNGTGPDHYEALTDPYIVKSGKKEIFEVPLTVTPLISGLPSKAPQFLRPGLRQWGAVTFLSVQHPLWLLKLITKTHVKRGGSTLSLTWHSSEMMPGGAPHMPDIKTVDKFLLKMTHYFDWLNDNFKPSYLTMNELRLKLSAQAKKFDNICKDWGNSK